MTDWRTAARLASRDGVQKRALIVALIVGSLLNLINQGDAIAAGAAMNWLKIVLTYAVPFVLSSHGAVSAKLADLKRG